MFRLLRISCSACLMSFMSRVLVSNILYVSYRACLMSCVSRVICASCPLCFLSFVSRGLSLSCPVCLVSYVSIVLCVLVVTCVSRVLWAWLVSFFPCPVCLCPVCLVSTFFVSCVSTFRMSRIQYSWARICNRLWSPGIDSEKSIPPAYLARRAGTKNRVVVLARQGGNRFLGPSIGLQIRALVFGMSSVL